MIVVEAVGVTRRSRPILAGIDLSVADGEILGIVGPNGSGKTTLLRTLYGAEPVSSGRVRIDGDGLEKLARAEIARRIAVVPQERPMDQSQTVADIIRLGRLPHRPWWMPGRSERDRVELAAARVGLSDLLARPLHSLSGGELQRALIARALCQDARHLLLDEPTNHLDLRYQHELLALVASLNLTAVVVLHDLNLAARYCQRIALLDSGRLSAIGAPEAVLAPQPLASIYGLPVDWMRTPAGRPHLIFADQPSHIAGRSSP
jgi:iron complex transport system ATP-binding protein